MGIVMRRIIVCCDGTWNHPDQKGRNDGPRKPSNIVKILRSIEPIASNGVSQLVYYDKGVGTGNILDKVVGGLKGKGLDENIIDCYRFIVSNYTKGDEIFIFGFSRGAYTARSLASFIDYIGLLSKDRDYFTPDAYSHYRDKSLNLVSFKTEHTPRKIKIKFVGVFDTVGAMGVPLKLFKKHNIKEYGFHDTSLSGCIENAYHALSTDEKRKSFKPSLWNDAVNTGQIMEQRWFAGVHTNIGGGYAKDGLANYALHWIVRHAQDCGLDVNYDYIWHYKPYWGHKLYNSMTIFFKLLGKHKRVINLSPNQTIDQSVKDRINHIDKYKPDNVSESFSFSETLRLNNKDKKEV